MDESGTCVVICTRHCQLMSETHCLFVCYDAWLKNLTSFVKMEHGKDKDEFGFGFRPTKTQTFSQTNTSGGVFVGPDVGESTYRKDWKRDQFILYHGAAVFATTMRGIGSSPGRRNRTVESGGSIALGFETLSHLQNYLESRFRCLSKHWICCSLSSISQRFKNRFILFNKVNTSPPGTFNCITII